MIKAQAKQEQTEVSIIYTDIMAILNSSISSTPLTNELVVRHGLYIGSDEIVGVVFLLCKGELLKKIKVCGIRHKKSTHRIIISY